MPHGAIWSWKTSWPTWKVFEPFSAIESETCEVPFSEVRRSAMRPPQPVTGPLRSVNEVCHCSVWSLCEKSCGGSAEPPCRYCCRCHRRDQRADVADEGDALLLEQRLEPDQARVQPVVDAVGVCAR